MEFKYIRKKSYFKRFSPKLIINKNKRIFENTVKDESSLETPFETKVEPVDESINNIIEENKDNINKEVEENITIKSKKSKKKKNLSEDDNLILKNESTSFDNNEQ